MSTFNRPRQDQMNSTQAFMEDYIFNATPELTSSRRTSASLDGVKSQDVTAYDISAVLQGALGIKDPSDSLLVLNAGMTEYLDHMTASDAGTMSIFSNKQRVPLLSSGVAGGGLPGVSTGGTLTVNGNVPAAMTVKSNTGESVTIPPERLQHALKIAAVGLSYPDVGDEGVIVAFATALVETRMRNLSNKKNQPGSENIPNDGDGDNYDSIGLFQQRPNWGTMEERMDPIASAKSFFGGPDGPRGGKSPDGLRDFPEWKSWPPGKAAQKVQVSSKPDEYAKWITPAKEILAALYAANPGGMTVTGGGASGLSGIGPSGSSAGIEEVIAANKKVGAHPNNKLGLSIFNDGLAGGDAANCIYKKGGRGYFMPSLLNYLWIIMELGFVLKRAGSSIANRNKVGGSQLSNHAVGGAMDIMEIGYVGLNGGQPVPYKHGDWRKINDLLFTTLRNTVSKEYRPEEHASSYEFNYGGTASDRLRVYQDPNPTHIHLGFDGKEQNWGLIPALQSGGGGSTVRSPGTTQNTTTNRRSQQKPNFLGIMTAS